MTENTTKPYPLHSLGDCRVGLRPPRNDRLDPLRPPRNDRLDASADRNDKFDDLRPSGNDRLRQPVTVNVEDAIFTRLVQAEELLTVAVGLFTELSENKANWLFRYQADIVDARWALREVLSDRAFGGEF
jgi:hypothetical protein